jgi:hypothetical protein
LTTYHIQYETWLGLKSQMKEIVSVTPWRDSIIIATKDTVYQISDLMGHLKIEVIFSL